MQAIALIETLDALHQRARQQHQRAGDRLHRLQGLRIVDGDIQPARVGVAQHRREIRIATTRGGIAHAGFVDQIGAQQRLARDALRMRTQPREGVVLDQTIRIHERQPRRIAVVGALIAAGAETGVVGIGDEAHARIGQRMALHDLQGAVGGSVVDDPDLRHAIGRAQSRQAIGDGFGALVGHDDGGDVGDVGS